MTTIDDLLAEITAREKTVKILLRQDLLEEHERLDAEALAAMEVDARENREPLAPGLAKQLLALEADIETVKRPFRFRSIGRKAWTDLLAAHPPMKAQLAEDARLEMNPDTFPDAAIAASCIDPLMTVEDVVALQTATETHGAINSTQFQILWTACLAVNVGGSDSPKSFLAGQIARLNGEYATTLANGESPALSSSGE